MNDDDALADPASPKVVPVCAIGASAGGVMALQGLFRQLPANLGLAYVVVLHLSPDQPSALSDILAGCTRMPVLQIQDGPTLKPDCVYVIPPDRELVIDGDGVTARPFSRPRGQRAPIDMFFRSVAAARGDGVAVVLSGAGSDGALGVQAIKEAGGVVMVQEPAEAGFPSMPQNAIASGVADFVAPLARLAERLAEVARSKEAVRSLDMDGSANDLRRIVAFLRARTGHDFASYKRATVMRRVTRRMQVCRTDTLAAYADYLASTPEEAKELFSDLLISVTMFFRDAHAFEALERKAIKPLFDDLDPEKEEPIRAWVVGCATGEEAYSVAMLLHEEAARRKLHPSFQIFASDLDEGSLSTAREGRYPRSIEADVSDERLSRFFVDEGTHYRVRKELRESVLFASHSVLKEPPFMRLDLITCRNLLIYLERALQQQVCSIFHYGLKPGRFLFLGSAETADSAANLFRPLDRDARIYAARPQAVHTLPILPQFTAPERFLGSDQSVPGRSERIDLPVVLHASALERTAPASALVDGTGAIVHLSPNAGRFILHSAGPISLQLPAIVRPELRLDLRLALTRALDAKELTLTHPTAVAFEEDRRRRIAMHVSPVPNGSHMGAQALVLFLDSGPVPDDVEAVPSSEVRPDEVRRLHAELKAAQEAVVASRAGHEAAIQDLRATNEELQSINEEYRSTAEELETSKEELQSINEELHTVNAELKSKLTSISVAHSDLQNLTDATEVGTLFLDGDLRIKMFTPPIADLFNISKADYGRVVTDFSHHLDYDRLHDDAKQVLRHLSPVEREVHSRGDRSFIMRMRPYRTIEHRIDGIVLTFFDITDRLRAETALARSEEKYRTIFQSIDEGFCVVEVILDKDGVPADLLHLEANEAYERYTGLRGIVGKRALEIIPEGGPWLDFYGRVALTGQSARNESFLVAPVNRWIASHASRIGGEGSLRVAVVFNDVTERKRDDAARRESEERQAFLLKLSDALRPLADPLEIQEIAARTIGEHLGADRAYYAVVKGDYDVAIVEREYRRGDVPSVVGTHPFAAFGSAFDAFRNGRTMAIDDLETADVIRSENLQAFRALAIRSLINTPLFKGGRSVAGFTVLGSDPRTWTAQEVSLVEEVAQRTWAAVERARAEAALRESESRRAFLLELSDALRALDDPAAIQGAAMQAIGPRLAVSRAIYFDVAPDGDTLRMGPAYLDGVGPFPASARLADFGEAMADAYRRGETVVVPDTAADDHLSAQGRAATAALQVRAAVGVPLLKGDDLVAIISVHHAETRAWTEAELKLLQEVAERTWAAAERVRAESALHESDARRLAIADAAPALVWETDARGVTFVNAQALEFFGVDFDRIETGGWIDFVHPDDRAGYLAEYLAAFARRRALEFDVRLLRADGEYRWTRTTGRPLGDDRFVGLWLDITEQKRAQEALRESEERQAFLLKLADALRPLTEPGHIERQATRLLGEHLQADRCFLSSVSADGTRMSVREQYLRSGASSVLGDYTFAQFGDFVGRDLHDGRILAVENVAALTGLGLDERASYAAVEIGAYLLVPLVRGGKLAALLTVNHRTPRAWSQADKAVARQTADRLWAARERARAEGALRESEELRRVALAGGRMGAWRWDLDARLVWGDTQFMAIYGLPPTEDAVPLALFTERMSAESAAEIEVIVTRAIAAGEEFDGPIRISSGPTAGRWIRWRGRTAPGSVSVLQGVAFDITEQTQAEAMLRESEERFRALVTTGAVSTYRMSPDWRLMYQLESDDLADTTKPVEDWVDKYIPADDRPTVFAAIAEAIRTKSLFELEHRVLLADGSIGWVISRAVPLLDTTGDIVEWFGTGSDVTPRKQAESALRDSEERLRQFGEASSDVLWIRDTETLQWTYLTPAFEAIYGIDRDTALRGDNMSGWTELIEPEDRERAVEALQRVREGERVSFEYRIRRPRDGTVRWLRNTDFPMRDPSGAVRWIGGIGRDITDEKETADRMGVLVAELQHRTRNLMGVVRSTTESTLRSSGSLEEFAPKFRDRIAALARVNGLLSRLNEHDRVTFDQVIGAEIAALGQAGGSDRITLEGPAGIALRSSTVQTFALALHELATNAVKYGALGQPSGRLTVRWRLERPDGDERPWLHVEWVETGVTMPPAGAGPQGGGAGRMLIERALPYQLGARTSYAMAADGVRCSISLPVSARTGNGDGDGHDHLTG